jgi:hypothetical protein
MCGVVTRKYKEKDQDDDLAKAFQYFDEDGMGKISVCFHPECLEAGSQSQYLHSRSPNAFLASS